MKIFSLLLMLGFGLLTGCARNYVVTLTNGTQVGTKNKPELKDGAYRSQIEPASSAGRRKKTGFLDAPSR